VTDPQQQATDKKVADYWDAHVDETFSGATYWLANPVIHRQYEWRAVGGRDYESWVNFSIQHFFEDRYPLDRILSVGCGDGVLERHLASINAALRIDGVDLAPGRIEIARREARKLGVAEAIHYSVCNAEANSFPGREYDAIYFNYSLHHMSNLDAILGRCSEALKWKGFLFVNEYIGPNRFAFSDREKAVMQSVFQIIPDRYRISHSEHDRGRVRQHAPIPDPAEVRRVDPSEAIHSAEIVDAIKRHFAIEEINYTIGTLMQFMLLDIAGNFREEDPESMRILQLIFEIEETLVSTGDLSPHFALIVAKPKENRGPENAEDGVMRSSVGGRQ
jgi:ubiquinone/menaquinone biosynthesis C-methylase UbiE